MRESATDQAILDEGRAEGRAAEARALLLRLGDVQFGPPSEAVQSAIGEMTDVDQLERLAELLLQSESWEELLAGA